jgi:hypothetical protein
VRYVTEATPLLAGMCWCRDCQKIACGSATVNVFFPESAVQFTGEIKTLVKVADSGNKLERGFCPNCGSNLFSRTIEPAGAPIRIRAGTLDDPELMAPQAIIWTDSAPSWAALDPKLPHFPKGPQ